MTWYISASGKKEAVIESVKATTADHLGEAEMLAFQRARDFAVATIESAPEGAEASVSCSGHATAMDGKITATSQSMSISAWLPEPKASLPE
jgi:hypothetical protein